MKTFVEIGACDFNNLTHLVQHNWKGVIVEPITKYFDNIPKVDNIYYVNAAIADSNGFATMYTAHDDVVAEDYDFAGMSSFYKGSWVLTEEVEVPTMTLDKLFSITNVTEIDYLKIDVEGYDFELLKMFPWDRITPKLIKFESKHIDIDAAIELLESKGYHCEDEGENTFAIKL